MTTTRSRLFFYCLYTLALYRFSLQVFFFFTSRYSFTCFVGYILGGLLCREVIHAPQVVQDPYALVMPCVCIRLVYSGGWAIG